MCGLGKRRLRGYESKWANAVRCHDSWAAYKVWTELLDELVTFCMLCPDCYTRSVELERHMDGALDKMNQRYR